jgi:hypothetical protein
VHLASQLQAAEDPPARLAEKALTGMIVSLIKSALALPLKMSCDYTDLGISMTW